MSHGNWKDMFKAFEENDFELLEFYIRQGIDVNYQHPEYMTNPLIESIRHNNIEMMVFLLEHDASPHVVEVYANKSALTIATELNNKQAVKILSQYM
jgi:ankyrin repeat protein